MNNGLLTYAPECATAGAEEEISDPAPRSGDATDIGGSSERPVKTIKERDRSSRSDPGAKDLEGCTPLHRAASNRSRDLVEELVDNGADINAQDQFGWTPLHFAADKGFADVVSLLIKKGAAVYRPDTSGFVPRDHAKANGHFDVVRILEAKPVH
jgi:ankyrin repeat protein